MIGCYVEQLDGDHEVLTIECCRVAFRNRMHSANGLFAAITRDSTNARRWLGVLVSVCVFV